MLLTFPLKRDAAYPAKFIWEAILRLIAKWESFNYAGSWQIASGLDCPEQLLEA